MLGAPGAGKGTQAAKICEFYQIPHISTGDIFRSNIKNGTELGKKARAYMDQGLLVPDELTVDLVMDRLDQDDAKKGYILDGFPRTIPQAKALEKALQERGDKLDYAIDIEVPDENIVDRMSGRRACTGCGATYHIKFQPSAKGALCEICGEPATEVHHMRAHNGDWDLFLDPDNLMSICHACHLKETQKESVERKRQKAEAKRRIWY